MSDSDLTQVTSNSSDYDIPPELLHRDSEPSTDDNSVDSDLINIPPEVFQRASDSDRSDIHTKDELYCFRFLDKVNGKTYLHERQASRRISHLQTAFKNDEVPCQDIQHLRKKFVLVWTDFADDNHRALIYYIEFL